MALERERETFERHKDELQQDAGKYVLIKGDEIVGIYIAYEDAIMEGYEKFGLEPFYVSKIAGEQSVQSITRILTCLSLHGK